MISFTIFILTMASHTNKAPKSKHAFMSNHTFQPKHGIKHNQTALKPKYMALTSNEYNIYLGMVHQFNSSVCNQSFHNFSYDFTCPTNFNRTECCYREYLNLNTSFGNAECAQYDRNDTYVKFDCQIRTSNSESKNWFDDKNHRYIMGGVVLFLVLCFLYMCCCRSKRRGYSHV